MQFISNRYQPSSPAWKLSPTTASPPKGKVSPAWASMYIKIAAQQHEWQVITEFEDVGISGSIHPLERPAGAKAFANGRPAVVAKLDRLSRDVEHIAGLMKRGNFKVATMPNASTVEQHIHAMLAEQERTFISERTKAALKSLEARAASGDTEAVQKINNRSQALAKGRSMLNRTEGHDTQRQQADERAALVKDTIELCMLKGTSRLQAVADCLIARNIPTTRGDQWSPTAVMRVMQRGVALTKAASGSVSSYETIKAAFRTNFPPHRAARYGADRNAKCCPTLGQNLVNLSNET